MASLATMQAERDRLNREMQRHGGAAKAPKYAQQIAALEAQIRTAKGSQKSQPVTTPKQTQRQETRLQYLKRVDPKNPEIKELERKIAKGGGSNPVTGDPVAGDPSHPFNQESIDQFLENALSGLGTLDLSGAPKLLSDGDVMAQRQKTKDAYYADNTQYLDRDRARTLEEAKQDMANRGIPYDPAAAADPNTKDLYGRTLGAIDQTYKADQASWLNKADTYADDAMLKQTSANIANRNSFADQAARGWQSKLDALNAGGGLLNTLMQQYGIDREEAQRILDRKSNEKLYKLGIKARPSSNGGGQQSGGNDNPGFELLD